LYVCCLCVFTCVCVCVCGVTSFLCLVDVVDVKTHKPTTRFARCVHVRLLLLVVRHASSVAETTLVVHLIVVLNYPSIPLSKMKLSEWTVLWTLSLRAYPTSYVLHYLIYKSISRGTRRRRRQNNLSVDARSATQFGTSREPQFFKYPDWRTVAFFVTESEETGVEGKVRARKRSGEARR
jgi:hypothetical protein